ncbi:MAG: primosomal protein N' [Lachnospiraceae bacterium]|nr:primosomal protein N' [Lachnospiraceae bacterium]
MLFCDVIVDLSLEKLDKTFQYRVPNHLENVVQEGCSVIIPFGNGGRTLNGFVLSLSKEPKIELSRIKDIIEVRDDQITIESQMIRLAAWIKRNYGSTMNLALKTVLPIKTKEKTKQEKEVHLLLSDAEAREQRNLMLKKTRPSKYKLRLLELLMEQRIISWDVISKEQEIPTSYIRDFEKLGWVEIQLKRAYRNPVKEMERMDESHPLNEEQSRAVTQILKNHEKNIEKTYLLYGVTGSGKTEVYMHLIQKMLEEGKETIVLIPEIALTRQTVMRFYQRFGDVVSIMNSRMTPGERYDQFERAKKGDCKIMVGPRSALFTPFQNLGMIIIDEEHENSYKSEQAPKYHARSVAVERARMANASVVLGSATPSVESYAKAMEGEYELLRLTKRVEERPLPECDVVDLRAELKSGNRTIFSRRLTELMQDRLAKGEQIMLFLNRRGMLGTISCRACGEVIKCPHCDVPMSLHRNQKLICHYCGYTIAMPKTCPSCNSPYIGGFRMGTEKVEDSVQKLFSGVKTLRMDADTTKGKEGHAKILEKFENREADILIGTQMIVKGHDFSNVTLVGILAADMSLNANDYRGAERTFQLLTQAAGRAGRGDKPGNVVIQTYQPEHFSIKAAAKQDYEEFYAHEIIYRKMLRYPPCAHMLMILVTSPKEEVASAQAKEIEKMIKARRERIFCSSAEPASIAKIQDVYRYVVYLKDAEYDRLVEIKDQIENYLLGSNRYSNAMVWFDFDPMSSF